MTSIFPLSALAPHPALPLGAFLGGAELLLILPIIGFGLATTVFWIWMIVDCAKRIGAGSQTHWIWLIVLLFSHFIGGLIYFFVGRTTEAPAYTPLNPAGPAPTAPTPAGAPTPASAPVSAVAPAVSGASATPLSTPREPSVSAAMASGAKCPQCGTALSPDAPEGLCPRCLVAENMRATAQFTGAEPASAAASGPVAPPLPPEEIAQKFPQLEILECLGRGGMGVVYKARQPRLDRLVALKILAPGKEKDPQFAERFTREAQALARLNHPNIVMVHDFGESGGLYYLLMEYVDGVNAREMLAGGKIAPAQALAIVPRICEALQYAHEQGVVHRDIKPENVLVDKQGRVKIADFGIAKMLGNESGPTFYTKGQQVMGTPYYMAPEQLERPSEVDHRADIYSLGVVFYEMLTGELPMGRFAPPSHKVQMDVRLDEVVLRTLEKEPQRRYQHASQVKTAVETITGVSTGTPPVPPSGAPVPAPAGSPPVPPLATNALSEQALAEAERRVRIPAVGLILAAIITLVFMLSVDRRTMLPPALFILMALANLFGAVRMLQLRSHAWAMAASILAMLSPPGFILGVPCGIWALIVLTRRDVREVFEAKEQQRRAGQIFNQPFSPTPFDSAFRPQAAEAAATATTLERARSLVRVPAIGLILSSCLTLALAGIAFVILILAPLMMHVPSPLRASSVMGNPVWKTIFLLFLTLPVGVAGLLILTGARRMLRLESQGWAVAAGILALLVPPFLLGWLFGLWALVILSRRDVSDAFAAQRQSGGMTTVDGNATGRSSNALAVFLVLAAIVLVIAIPLILGVGWVRVRRTAMTANESPVESISFPAVQVHQWILEAPANLVDRVVPQGMRSSVGNEDTAYQTATIGQDALNILLRGSPPLFTNVLVDRVHEVQNWPGDADTWTYARSTAGVEYVGSGAGVLGLQDQSLGLLLHAEYQVMHSPGSGKATVTPIFFEGAIPPDMALVFLIPQSEGPSSDNYLVIAFEPPLRNLRSPRSTASASVNRSGVWGAPAMVAVAPTVPAPPEAPAGPEAPTPAQISVPAVLVPSAPETAPSNGPEPVTEVEIPSVPASVPIPVPSSSSNPAPVVAPVPTTTSSEATTADLQVRLQAAETIAAFTARDQALRRVAIDAAGLGDAAVVQEALRKMEQFTERDAAASEAAVRLAKAGQRAAAIAVAQTISQFTVRDDTLRQLSQ